MKHYGKLTAAAAAGFMALSAMGVAPVFAAETSAEIPVNKTATKDNSALLPDVNSTVEIKNGPVGTIGTQTVKNGVTAAPGLLSFKENDSTLEINNDKNGYVSTALVVNDENVAPGIYSFIVGDTTNHGTGALEGMTGTKTSYVVLVHVYGDNTPNTVYAYEGSALPTDVNVGKVESLDFAAALQTSTLTLTKNVTGNQSTTNDVFKFAVDVTANATTDGLTYSTDGGTTWAPLKNEDGSFAITKDDMKHGSTIMIGGLTTSDDITITETLTGLDGYSLDSINAPETWTNKNTTTGVASGDAAATGNIDVTYVNKKEGAVPTGILMTAAPYAALVGLGGIFAGFFFRRKRED